MSDFLFIIPEGWVQLDWSTITNSITTMNLIQVLDWINFHILVGSLFYSLPDFFFNS